MFRFNLLCIPQYNPFFLKNILEIWMKPNILTIYHKCPYVRNNQNSRSTKEIFCWYLFWNLLFFWFYLSFCFLHLMSILTLHVFHNPKTLYSWNRKILNNKLPLDLIFPTFLVYEQFLWKKALSVIINFNFRFPRYIVRCCMWSVCYYRTKKPLNPTEYALYRNPNNF